MNGQSVVAEAAIGRALSGHATVVEGADQTPNITTPPVAGADCVITGSTGAHHQRHRLSLTEGLLKLRLRLLMYGVLMVCLGLAMYLFGVLLALPRYLLGDDARFLAFNEWVVWYSGVPLVLGLCLGFLDLFVLLGRKRSPRLEVRHDLIANTRLVVALTAYDDEDSIGDAVRDFLTHPLVDEVIVVSNNSKDRTLKRAMEAGATAINEPRQGYGRCVFRCFQEAITRSNELLVLCEGDRTFRAHDLDKFLAYATHADIVHGTRTVERLRARDTQLTTFMYYGNLFVGKVLEAKHLGQSTITDVGTTYKLCRREALTRLMPHLDPAVNLEFNAHFLDVALDQGYDIVECPITFHPRVGLSKGGNVNNMRALRVGLRMLFGIAWSWKAIET